MGLSRSSASDVNGFTFSISSAMPCSRATIAAFRPNGVAKLE